jgi:release factor glutamine methyltransferase
MGTEIEVGPGVLVPRAETELLGRTALSFLAALVEPLVIDMCCGSGNVGLGIFAARPDARIYGADVTADCVAWARRNVERLGCADRVTYDQGDMFAGLEAHDLLGRVDLVACNPPYISTGKLDGDSAYLLENEPREAFDAGPYGISLHQRLIAEAAPFLRRDGWLVFEFGAGQDRQVKALLARSRAYTAPHFRSDSDGVLRVAAVQKL